MHSFYFQGIYDMHIHMQGVPLLGWEPAPMLSTLKARYVVYTSN